MCEPRHFATLWAFKACYRDSFTFIFIRLVHGGKNVRHHSMACILLIAECVILSSTCLSVYLTTAILTLHLYIIAYAIKLVILSLLLLVLIKRIPNHRGMKRPFFKEASVALKVAVVNMILRKQLSLA
jgi:hypothetical protein